MRLSTVSGSSKAEVSDLVDRRARGSAFLRSDDDRQVGVRVAATVLVDYGKDFHHPGWRPRRSSRGDPAVTELTAETTASFMAAYPG